MEYLARKISRAKWEIKPSMGQDEISADAITGCLRTQDNALSFWQCNLNEEDVTEVVLALVTSMQRIDAMQIVLLHRNELEADIFTLKSTPGNTPIDDLHSRHRDVVNLDMKRLCALAEKIATKVRGDSDCYQFTRVKVREILHQAVKTGRVRIDQLQDKVQGEIRKIQ